MLRMMFANRFRNVVRFSMLAAMLPLVGPTSSNGIGQELTLVRNVFIFNGADAPDDQKYDLVIKNGEIAEIVAGGSFTIDDSTTVVNDLESRYITPGLISAHSHLGQTNGTKRGPSNFTRHNVVRQLEQYLNSGVTTVVSLGTNLPEIYPIRDEIRRGEINLPLVLSADAGIGAVVGPPDAMQVNDKDAIARPSTPLEAYDAVKQAHALGADCIKMWVDSRSSPSIPSEIAKAVIDESHRLNLKVFAHVYTLQDAKMLVLSGVDVIAHGVRDQPVDPEFISMMKEKKVWYIPTLALDDAFFIYADQPKWISTPYFTDRVQPELLSFITDPKWRSETLQSPRTKEARQAVSMNQRNLHVLHASGVQIAFGTDSGAFPLRIPGIAEHRELELMVSAGLSPLEAFKIATSQTANLLGLADQGQIRASTPATFVVFDDNPLEDIQNLRSLRKVWLNGKEVWGKQKAIDE